MRTAKDKNNLQRNEMAKINYLSRKWRIGVGTTARVINRKVDKTNTTRHIQRSSDVTPKKIEAEIRRLRQNITTQ